jgi:acyl-CoA synthetase (AMP-forming)/AMP-acid ligase II
MVTIGNRRDIWRIRVTQENLAALAEGAFDRLGDYENLIFEGKSYSSGELLDRARRAGSGLSKLGVEPGDRVVVLMATARRWPSPTTRSGVLVVWSPRWSS